MTMFNPSVYWLIKVSIVNWVLRQYGRTSTSTSIDIMSSHYERKKYNGLLR